MAKTKPAKHRPKKKEPARKPAAKAKAAKAAPAKSAKPAAAAKGRPSEKSKAAPAPAPKKAKPEPAGKAGAPATPPVAAGGPAPGKPGIVVKPGLTLKSGRPDKKGRKGSRRQTLIRRGPDGEILAPGDLLLPGGTQRVEEIQYLFRGWSAAEHPNVDEEAVAEVFARRPAGEFPGDRDEIARVLSWARDRFDRGNIEPLVPQRTKIQRTFQGVVERARHRRREIGAFLRGLDLGHTETGHMDAHGEASLQSLMEWAARLENLTEADEPGQADYAQFHRGLDQLESTTEALIIDVEQTLRRLKDRVRA
ncbi:MAG: hypothetical protein U0599_14150 [Vicinamibacteria bacterium]